MTKSPLDLAIIGGGVSALSAGIYSARAGLNTAIYEQRQFGGILPEISDLANYPGFIGTGATLAKILKDQAINAGAKVNYGKCTGIEAIPASPGDSKNQLFRLIVDDVEIFSRTILIATGSEPRTLDFANLNLRNDKPISYCALCDAPLYKNKTVLVIGGGNSAVSEAIHLAAIVQKVILVSRSNLRAESALVKKLQSFENVAIHTNTQLSQSHIDSVDGIFVFIGKIPATDFLEPKYNQILSDDGYIVTDEHFETAVPGIFSAGDVRQNSIKQVVTAAAEGASATIAISSRLRETK